MFLKRSITRPIVYGNIAWWQGPNVEAEKSHKWLCYLRGPQNEDLSSFVEKVVFHLHPSFSEPVRGKNISHVKPSTRFNNSFLFAEFYKAPYQVEEYGWGEFEIIIVIVFKDKSEKNLEIRHNLRLFPHMAKPAVGVPVITEQYDEIVFTSPSEELRRSLDSSLCQEFAWEEHPSIPKSEATPSDNDLHLITSSIAKAKKEVNRLKELYLLGEKEALQLKEEVQAIIDRQLEMEKGIETHKHRKRKIVLNSTPLKKPAVEKDK